MRFLLDANVVIALGKEDPRIFSKVLQHGFGQCALSAIVLHELYYGAFKGSLTERSLENVEALPFDVLDFNRDDARAAGEIRATLHRAGEPIGPYDTLIAGQALARDLTMVTRNVREFPRLAGLRVEDWESG